MNAQKNGEMQPEGRSMAEGYTEEEVEEAIDALRKTPEFLAYEQEDDRLREMSSAVAEDVLMVDLGASDSLRDLFMKAFQVRELPVLIADGKQIYYSSEFRKEVEGGAIEMAMGLIKKSRMALFIKGTPTSPQCGFTVQLMRLMEEEGLVNGRDYVYYDILTNAQLREGLKRHSQWPTYPQIYIDGEFCGGLDVFRRMKESGELSRLQLRRASE